MRFPKPSPVVECEEAEPYAQSENEYGSPASQEHCCGAAKSDCGDNSYIEQNSPDTCLGAKVPPCPGVSGNLPHAAKNHASSPTLGSEPLLGSCCSHSVRLLRAFSVEAFHARSLWDSIIIRPETTHHGTRQRALRGAVLTPESASERARPYERIEALTTWAYFDSAFSQVTRKMMEVRSAAHRWSA
jgi:hypothetical protein